MIKITFPSQSFTIKRIEFVQQCISRRPNKSSSPKAFQKRKKAKKKGGVQKPISVFLHQVRKSNGEP
jgi:hypothetical protein